MLHTPARTLPGISLASGRWSRYGGDQDVAVLSMMTDLRLAKSVGGCKLMSCCLYQTHTHRERERVLVYALLQDPFHEAGWSRC